MRAAAGAPPDSAFALSCLPPAWRMAAALLRALARGNLVAILVALLFLENPPTNPLYQIRLFLGLFAAPELAWRAIVRAFAGTARIGGGTLEIAQREQRIEVPLAAIAAVEPWKVPLPTPGVSLRLRSGRRFEIALGGTGVPAFVESLVAAGADAAIRKGLDHAVVAFTEARRAVLPGVLENPFLKYVVYALVPTVPAHRLHQFITYGGWWGEWYTYGGTSWTLGFALWWTSFAFWLLVIASAIRAGVEVVAISGTALAPGSAFAIRRGLEITQRVMFYVGIPLVLYLRFTA